MAKLVLPNGDIDLPIVHATVVLSATQRGVIYYSQIAFIDS